MEYKSPEDGLDIDAFYKAGAYAGLYKSYGETTDAIKADIVTGELDEVSHIWLGALSERVEKQRMVRLLENVGRLSGKADREFADSVLEVRNCR